jgi:hypothetical protein
MLISMRIKLQDSLERYLFTYNFAVLNGIKQGATVSPVLFWIYFVDLLRKLQDSTYGCFIGDIFVGALSYADDLTLLFPTPI